jgi:hypothetical protein
MQFDIKGSRVDFVGSQNRVVCVMTMLWSGWFRVRVLAGVQNGCGAH